MIKTGNFVGTAAAINLDIGFVPDWFRLIVASGNNDVIIHEWFRLMGEAGQADIAEGWNSDEGVTTDNVATAGISAYDSSGVYVRIPHPDGTRNKYVGVSDPANYAISTAYSNARSTTAVGDVVRAASTAGVAETNGLVYECTNSGTSDSAAPTWPTTPGESVADNDMIWICRREDTFMGGFKGVSLAAAMTEDSIESFYIAVKADQNVDHGDAAAFTV